MTFRSRAALAACLVVCALSSAQAEPQAEKQAEPEAPVGDCRLDKADHTIHGVTLGD
jgi:hypothetical protein